MAATKLNPSAPPFPRPCHFGPAAPPLMLPYHHHAACPPPGAPPFGPIYLWAAPFSAMPSPHHHHPFIQFPVLCKATGHALQGRFLRKGFVAPKQTARASRKVAPAAKAVAPAQPAEHDDRLPEDVGEPAPHGLPLHKLMIPGGGGRRKKPASEAAATGQKPAVERLARHKAEGRDRNKRKPKPNKVRDGAVVGPREARPSPPRAWTTWMQPTSAFTTQRIRPLPKYPPAYLGFCTTLMMKNIPNRLKCDEMIALLDQHCARANRLAGAVVAAYNVLYLPIDFRRQGNYGYAFVNFTTADAALGLYYSLQGCGWKVCGSTKIIEIVPANIQGKAELVRHLNRHRFECETVEYLPVVFTPPRDGGAQATATTTTRVGKLAAAWTPRFVKATTRKAYARVVRPKVQQG